MPNTVLLPQACVREIFIPDRMATNILAQLVAPYLEIGDCVTLHGPLGAGKTHFCKALIRNMGVRDDEVTSPTYNIVQTYETHRGVIWHVDLYRLRSGQEVAALGLEEGFIDGIVLIEWPQQVPLELPPNRIDFSFDFHPSLQEARLVTMQGQGRLKDMCQDLPLDMLLTPSTCPLNDH